MAALFTEAVYLCACQKCYPSISGSHSLKHEIHTVSGRPFIVTGVAELIVIRTRPDDVILLTDKQFNFQMSARFIFDAADKSFTR